jgi:hypothetical protein
VTGSSVREFIQWDAEGAVGALDAARAFLTTLGDGYAFVARLSETERKKISSTQYTFVSSLGTQQENLARSARHPIYDETSCDRPIVRFSVNNIDLSGDAESLAVVHQITVPGTSLVGVDSLRAHVLATTTLDSSSGKRILNANADNVTITNVFFDGQKDTRNPGPCGGADFGYGKNIAVIGNGFRLLNIRSAFALCGSGAEVQGGGFEIANSFFGNNGYPADQGGPWSDGLTVWACNGGSSIHDSSFLNNTDVDLVIGGGDGGTCSVTNNTIQNNSVHAFAGIHVGYFDGGGGNHSGLTYSGNTITSSLNMLAFGMVVGFHPWSSESDLKSAGSVTGNSISGAVINLQIEADKTGLATGSVTSNSVSGAQGSFGFGACNLSANYAVYPQHAGLISYDPGFLNLQFDDSTCTIWQ